MKIRLVGIPMAFLIISILLVNIYLSLSITPLVAAQEQSGKAENTNEAEVNPAYPLPELKDPRLKVEVVTDGLSVPTGIAFLDNDTILVLKRYSSGFQFGGLTTVNLIKNGTLQDEPVLTVLTGLCDKNNVQPKCSMHNERGLLGIATKKINATSSLIANNTEVFLYYTEITLNGEILGNRVYKYIWDGNKLTNSTLILNLPASPGPRHNAGKVLIGPDGYLYTVIGDQSPDSGLNPSGSRLHRGQLQNIASGPPPDNTSVILRVDPHNGLPAPGNPFVNTDNHTGNASNATINALSRYFAYGIRNSFGLAIDPVTGKLWDTENGVDKYDEINLVEPGFNSGWRKIMGPMSRTNITGSDLVKFPGSNYSDPEFSWNHTVSVTDLEFFNSSQLGKKYENNLFVGDYVSGSLYFFKLNKNRDGFDFGKGNPGLSDRVADNEKERTKLVLGTGFDIITDIKTGPDGYLYIVSYVEGHDNISRIYRIVPE